MGTTFGFRLYPRRGRSCYVVVLLASLIDASEGVAVNLLRQRRILPCWNRQKRLRLAARGSSSSCCRDAINAVRPTTVSVSVGCPGNVTAGGSGGIDGSGGPADSVGECRRRCSCSRAAEMFSLYVVTVLVTRERDEGSQTFFGISKAWHDESRGDSEA